MRGRRLTLLTMVAVLATACGGDTSGSAADGQGAATPAEGEQATGAPAEVTAAPAAGIDVAAFCDSAIEGEQLFNAGPELDEAGNPTAEGLEEFRGQLDPIIATLETHAPDEVAADVEALASALRTALEEGDQGAMQTPEVLQADAAVDAYVFEHCELGTTEEVVAVDYAFEDVPQTWSAGQVGVRLDNQGEELHEGIVLRISDDVDLSINELLALPEDEAMQMAEFRGAVFAAPGEQASAVMDLTPGRYALVCFIPVGTTSLDEVAGPETGDDDAGPPHFTRGMVSEFTVE